MRKGVLIVISGFSGAGKGTITKKLLADYDNYALSISMTTRQPRPGEVHGKEYFFVDRETFERHIAEDALVEYAEYVGNYYGTPKEEIEKNLSAGRDVILEIEPQGAMQVKAKMPEAVLVFIVPPTMKTLRKRLEDRGREDNEEIEKRINAAKWEFSQAEKYNNIVVNDDLDECVEDILCLMSKYKKERQIIENLLNE